MQIFQNVFRNSRWQNQLTPDAAQSDLLIYFGSRRLMEDPSYHTSLKEQYPNAQIVGCSTGGEIIGDEVNDETLVTTALRFNNTQIKVHKTLISDSENNLEVGRKLGDLINSEDLAGVMVLSDGTKVNGTDLIRGIKEGLKKTVPITGGLAGGGASFEKTLVAGNDIPEQGAVVAVGFYGNHVKIGHGSYGGWESFGPKRTITRSERNVLYELDGKPALALYKKYLGAEAMNFPESALFFPLTVYPKGNREGALVRTVLNINEEDQSLTFAGDIPQGYVTQLMRGDINSLTEGASLAAKVARKNTQDKIQLAILVSCVGRKLLMGQHAVDEIEAVNDVLGRDSKTIGFYSYGEICPLSPNNYSELHNQIMAITTLSEMEG